MAARVFEEAVALAREMAPLIANVMVNIAPTAKAITSRQVASLARLLATDALTFAQAREVAEMVDGTDEDPETVADAYNMRQSTDMDTLAPIVDDVLATCVSQVWQYENGNKKVIGYLVGQCMKAARGNGNPKLFNQLLLEKLGA